ncbi:MAG: hypothetical protein FWD26_01830 [Treponema sp.]|nr:hypothetical protein [Treponema sp.]
MIKILLSFVIVFALTGCPEFDNTSPGSVRIYLDDQERGSFVAVQKGQEITLRAQTENAGNVSIIWEITGSDAVITSAGVGSECTVRGENINTSGSVSITVKAWKSNTGGLVSKTISVFIYAAAQAEGVNNILGLPKIEVGEEQILSAELIPLWAAGNLTWSQSPQDMVELVPIAGSRSCIVKGLIEGDVTITASINGFSKTFNMQITEAADITIRGIRINFANEDREGKKLPVTNIIWLYPNDIVQIEADYAGGTPLSITWTTGNVSEVQIEPNGKICALKGISISNFKDPPAVVRVTAHYSDNSVNASVLVKTQALPIWAWDRARDGHLNLDITPPNPPTSELPALTPRPTLSSYESAVNYKMYGRGEYAEGMPVKVKGNFIPYTASGLLLNSSNNVSGNNPDPVAFPRYGSADSANSHNSTRIMIGSNIHDNTDTDVHRDGVFDLLTPDKNIRISVDYEIIWSAPASRDMWIMVNNNNANAAQSIMGTASQLLIEPLVSARGTRATAVTYLNVRDLAITPGFDNLAKAFIAIIVLSNGGSIYVSGIRIEEES